MTAPQEDLDLALELAGLADQITGAAFRSEHLVVDTKPDLTPVTEADRAVEERIRAVLSAARPGDAVVGEELGESGPGGRRRWIVDPIDGTKNFVRNIPVWATLIALEVEGLVTVGVVSAPALGRRWWAARGLGAFAGPVSTAGLVPPAAATRIRVSSVRELADASLSGAGLLAWGDRGGPRRAVALALRCWRDRDFGDFWSHVLVAEGACDVALDPVVALWDLAAIQVIVEEAGGKFTDLDGNARPDGGSAVSSNGLLHAAVLEVLSEVGAGREEPGKGPGVVSGP